MVNSVTFSSRGRLHQVPAYSVANETLIVRGKVVRTAFIFDEDWRETPPVESLGALAEAVRASNMPADVFAFSQKLPATFVLPGFPYLPYNLAVTPTSDFGEWWEARLPQETRKHVRKSRKLGLAVRGVQLDGELAQGIKAIYDESPIRQGRAFWHYGKPVEVVKLENSSYLDRSILIGAYHGPELVGFMKLVRVGSIAQVMQLIAKSSHSAMKTNNALIANAVEMCSVQGIAHLAYGQYIYGKNRGAQLTEFKRRNGFEMVVLPRYFIPLTLRGRLAVSIGLHRGVRDFLPDWFEEALRSARSTYYEVVGKSPLRKTMKANGN